MSRLFSILNRAAVKKCPTGPFAVVLLMAVSNVAVANDRPIRDPFERPALFVPALQSPTDGRGNTKSFAANADLTAILQAGNNSMVIVDGRTLGLGEEIDGYRLIQVRERSAVFVKNRQRIILEIDKVDETN